jgi:hypothetical protein
MAITESTIRPNSIGKDSEKGLFQIRQETWGEVPDEIEKQVDLACKIMYINYVTIRAHLGSDGYGNTLDDYQPDVVYAMLKRSWKKGVYYTIKHLDSTY